MFFTFFLSSLVALVPPCECLLEVIVWRWGLGVVFSKTDRRGRDKTLALKGRRFVVCFS